MDYITLQNKGEHKIIKDLLMYPLKVNSDESGGILVETLRKDWKSIYGPGREFSMQYYSVTPTGVARDESVWHLHPTYQEDRFLMAKGAAVVAVADNREDSETKGLLNLFYITADKNPYIVLIPVNTLHGFIVVSEEDGVLLNFPTGLYNPEEEGRVSHEEAGVRLPNGEIFTWDKVRNNPPDF